MPTYALGRDAVATLPGVNNSDIKDVTINISAEELDVTVFKSTALTQAEYFPGLVDCTIDVTCTAHDAAIGDKGTQAIAGLPTDFDAVVLNIGERIMPRGIVEYTLTYGFTPQD